MNATKFYELTEEQKYQIINRLYLAYYNTDQEVSDFAKEFFFVVGHITRGEIPLELDHLTDYENVVREVIPTFPR